MNKKIVIIGGGTLSYVRSHFAVCAPAKGATARKLKELCEEIFDGVLDTNLYLTEMAVEGHQEGRRIVTNEDVSDLISDLITDLQTKIVFMPVALCDFEAIPFHDEENGKYGKRLNSENLVNIGFQPKEKVVNKIRKDRKDIFLVGFKQTCGLSEDEQYLKALKLCKTASCNLVFANDVKNKRCMIVTPEEARYHVIFNKDEGLRNLVEMTKLRSHLTFTRSTVIDAEPVSWDSNEVPSALRESVDYCINKGAYKPFNGATVGHFACKLSDNEFLTSMRKTNFNDIRKNGLVRIKTDGPDRVLAYGGKPSVGGQSQRIIFSEHKGNDCILHFHCPKRENSLVPTVSQREYECGSHQCGQNTSNGLKQFGNLKAVYLDNHGPNIVFHSSINPKEVINFIEENFILEEKTGGYV
jgi:hypothetical protein